VLVGYMRVSKADGSQTTDLQRDALLAAGTDAESLYEDKASGKKEERPQLAACLKALRPGDTLLVWKLERLGRDLRHLVNVVHDLTERGIGLKVLTGQGAAIDTTTASGNWSSESSPASPSSSAAHLRTHHRRPRLCAGTWPQRRTALQDDVGQTPARHGLHGQARNQSQRTLHRTRHHPPDPLPACVTHRRRAGEKLMS
jgi:hypothetical protein